MLGLKRTLSGLYNINYPWEFLTVCWPLKPQFSSNELNERFMITHFLAFWGQNTSKMQIDKTVISNTIFPSDRVARFYSAEKTHLALFKALLVWIYDQNK